MPAPSGEIDESGLIQAAHLAARSAYAPYSQFPVGAALQTGSGRIVTGCNVENASFGLTICAERVAVCKAISDGERDFHALAVSVPGGGSPCGACRQVLHEFNAELPILVCDENRSLVAKYSLNELLPHGFKSQFLEQS